MATKVAHEKTRQKILDAATELFLKNGYEQTTTREIAKQLEISQPALYHHFGDKETLFVEVIRTVGGQIRTEMEEVLATDYASSLDQLTDMTLAILTRHPRDVFTLIHGSFPALSAGSQRILGMTFGVDYVAPVQKFFESDAVVLQDDVDAHVASSFYITSLAPLFSNFHALDANQDLRDRVEQLLNLILYGVATK